MRAKKKHQDAIAKVTRAMMDRVESDQFTKRLRDNPVMEIFLQLGAIYTGLGEPFVTINPTTQERELSVPLYPERPTKPKQRDHPPLLAMNQSAFIRGREQAEAATQRIVWDWAKAGIPPWDVRKILGTIAPGHKRFVAQLAHEHGRIVSTIEAQRESCYLMTRLVARDDGLTVLPREVRMQIATATIRAVETCTMALSKLTNAGQIIETAKRAFVHFRNPIRRDAEMGLVRLREKHIKERKATRARETVRLLQAFDPDTPWNEKSIRAGRVYRKP